MGDSQILAENKNQINPERIIERLKLIEFQLSIKRGIGDGEKEQPHTLVN
jgi:hypothetical protein